MNSQGRSFALPGRHFYQFYKGREDFFRLAIPFLREGLKNGEAGLWLVSRQIGLLEATYAFQRYCDLRPYIERKQLSIIPAERWYADRGRFSEGKTLERIRKFIREKEKLGYLKLRGVGDLGWAEPKDWDRIHTYEKKVQGMLQGENILGVCAYPLSRCSLSQTKDILESHDGVFQHRL